MKALKETVKRIADTLGFDQYFFNARMRRVTNGRGQTQSRKIVHEGQDVKIMDNKGNYFYVRSKGAVKVVTSDKLPKYTKSYRLAGVYSCDCDETNMQAVVDSIIAELVKVAKITEFDDNGFDIYKSETNYEGKDIDAFYVDFTYTYWPLIKTCKEDICQC